MRRHVKRITFAFTPLPSRILDRLTDLTPTEFYVYATIARFTWGRGKDSDTIANLQIQEATGLSERTVQYAISELKKKGHILATGPARHPRKFTINYPPKLKIAGAPHCATDTLPGAPHCATVAHQVAVLHRIVEGA